MTTHRFTLIVEGVDINDPDVFDAPYEAGCDDATIGTTDGIQVMDFSREALKLDAAGGSRPRRLRPPSPAPDTPFPRRRGSANWVFRRVPN